MRITIQDATENFAKQHSEIIYVVEYDAFYRLNETTKHYQHFNITDLEQNYIEHLRAVYNSKDITTGTLQNFNMWLTKLLTRVPTINTQEAIFNDLTVLNLRTFETYSYTDQKIFYHINSDAPNPSPTPIFTNFLNQVLVKEENLTEPDQTLIGLCQEMFGYYLTDKIEPPTAFFLTGEGANGKSTLIFILEQLMGGDEFVMTNSIENLTSGRFDAGDLRFKRLNRCGDEQSKFLKQDRFKGIIEGDLTRSDVKFKSQVHFRPHTKHIFATNKMPRFEDFDYGLKRRFKILPFFRKFSPEEADKTLKTEKFEYSKFAPELPGIINWAIEGAKRFIGHNYTFSDAEAATTELRSLELANSSVAFFIDDNFENLNDNLAPVFSIHRLYKTYMAWCKDSSGNKPVSVNNFRKEIKKIFKSNPYVAYEKATTQTVRGYRAAVKADSVLNDSIFQGDIDQSKEPNY